MEDLSRPLLTPGVGGFLHDDFVTLPAPLFALRSFLEPSPAQAPPFRFLESLSFAYHIFIHKKYGLEQGEH